MNSRILVLAFAVGITATLPAFASRARTLVMGTGDPLGIITSGSLYYDDKYNLFYNPAYTNDFRNWAIIEKSNSVNSTAQGGFVASNFPNTTAQGGFVASMINFAFGLYLNRGDAIQGLYSTRKDMRPVEVTLGADMGAKLGVTFLYGAFDKKSAAQNGTSDQDMTLRAGLSINDLEPFGSFKISGKESIAAYNTYKSWTLGARYKWGEWTPYTMFRRDSINGATISGYGLGLGRNASVTDGVKLSYALGYWRMSSANHTVIPIDLALEGEATSWLVLRAGLSYRLMDRTDSDTQSDSTTGRLGATLHLGKADLDWAIGKTGFTTEGPGPSPADTQVFDIASGFFTAASLAYHW